MKNRKFVALTLVFVLAVYAIAPIGIASAQTGNPLKNISVSGTNGFTGTLDITGFAVKKGQVVANGTLKGTLNGQQVNQAVTLPVSTGQHSCDILHLTLGPLHLNLLGLVVDLNQIELDITAQQGSGNLLGNLLCQVAQLLDGNGRALGKLANLLNQILSALG